MTVDELKELFARSPDSWTNQEVKLVINARETFGQSRLSELFEEITGEKGSHYAK